MIELESPEGPLRITRDGNGYPSIVARNAAAAAWAKGWLHAQDRLAQVLLTRMAAQGRLMELLGSMPMSRTVDRAVRLLRIPMGIEAHVAALDDRAGRILRSYCDGMHAGRARRKMFDRSLALAGVDTREFTPGDVLLSYRMLCFFGLTSFQQIAELLVGEIVQDGGDERLVRLLMGDAADGIDLDAIRGMSVPADLALLNTPLGGSNAMAIGAGRSASGGALLMSDPHLEIARFPPLLYASHEEYADGRYLQGMYVPGIPWLTMGRTRDCGWTYTFGHADNVDVLIERCEAGRYQRPDGWHALRRRTERVKVRGGEDELWTYWDNPFGSIAAEHPDGDLPCVRWAGLHESTGTDANAILGFPSCHDVRELVEAHRAMRTISLAGVFADRAGDIAWVHTGHVDARDEEWTGAYPRPGWTFEGSLETLTEDARPVLIAPEDDFIASANERVDGMGGERWVNYPEPPYRLQRLREIVGDRRPIALRDLAVACFDETDGMATRLAPIWAPLLADVKFDAVAAWAAAQPTQQDDDGRDHLGLFHALHHEVVRALLERDMTPANSGRVLDELGALLCFQSRIDDALALERPDELSEIELQELLRTAWPRAKRLVGSGEWAIPVRARFKSIFTQGKLPSALGFSSDPIDFPGGPTSPFQTRVMAFEGEQMIGGPAGRYCCDMSDEGGWYHIPGGASELPWGRGYGTGLKAWRRGRFAPLGRPTQPPPDVR